MVERTRDNQRFDQIGSGDRVYAVGAALTGSADVSSGRAWELADQNALAELSFGRSSFAVRRTFLILRAIATTST
jgi:hypothetical protein